jgi:hypothetical protein
MTKILLDQSWIYAGKFYGPGEVDIEDEEAYTSIKGKIDAAAKATADTLAPVEPQEAAPAAEKKAR